MIVLKSHWCNKTNLVLRDGNTYGFDTQIGGLSFFHSGYLRLNTGDKILIRNCSFVKRHIRNPFAAIITRLLPPVPPNKSLDASGGSVFRIMTGAAMLE